MRGLIAVIDGNSLAVVLDQAKVSLMISTIDDLTTANLLKRQFVIQLKYCCSENSDQYPERLTISRSPED